MTVDASRPLRIRLPDLMISLMGEKIVRFRWWVLLAWAVATAALILWTPPADPTANELVTFLPEDAPSVRASVALSKHFPKSAGLSQAVIVFERTGPTSAPATAPASAPKVRLSQADVGAVNDIAKRLRRELPEDLPVREIHVCCPGDIPPLVKPNLYIAKDRAAAIVIVNIPASFITTRSARTVKYIRGVLQKAQTEDSWPTGLTAAG